MEIVRHRNIDGPLPDHALAADHRSSASSALVHAKTENLDHIASYGVYRRCHGYRRHPEKSSEPLVAVSIVGRRRMIYHLSKVSDEGPGESGEQ